MDLKKISNEELLDVYKTLEDFLEFLQSESDKEKNVGENDE